MEVKRLDHVNIKAVDLVETVAFYTHWLGLTPGPIPGMEHRRDHLMWLHDSSGAPILHVGTVDLGIVTNRPPSRGGPDVTTGALDHVALECTGHDEMIARLEAADHPHWRNEVPGVQLRQIFMVDPNGVLLELNFRGGA